MADALVLAFVAAKFENAGAGVALYAVSEDAGGRKIALSMQLRAASAISRMIKSSCEEIAGDPAWIAQTLQSAMAGVSRAMLERGCQARRDGAGVEVAGESLPAGLGKVADVACAVGQLHRLLTVSGELSFVQWYACQPASCAASMLAGLSSRSNICVAGSSTAA